jgi:hypothetical protein
VAHDNLIAARPAERYLDRALTDDIEVIARLPFVYDLLPRRKAQRPQVVGNVEHLLVGQEGQGAGHPLVDDLAVSDEDGALYPAGQRGVVGDHDDRLATLDQTLEHRKDRLGRLGVEVAGRLVGHEDGRVVGESARDGHPLLLPAGERRGQLVRLVGHPHQVQQLQGPALALRREYMPQKSIGSMMFSSSESMGRSWKNWKTMPRLRPRHAASRLSLSLSTRVSPTYTSPSLGRSMPVSMLIRVDLPLPDLPMMPTNSPASNSASIPFKIVTSPVPALKRLTMWLNRISDVAGECVRPFVQLHSGR